ncbi:MAG TPA: tetratricopeptide repeat protein, partial [bacterium]|nr:tetratricopeptide repeat protein [bacterium]
MKKLLLTVLVIAAACLLVGLKTASVSAQTSAEEYFVAGVEFFEGKNYTAAATAFEKAVELKPDYEDARFNLAVTYWTQKQYQKAAATLEELIQRNPESEVGKQAAQELDKLKKSGIFAKEEE